MTETLVQELGEAEFGDKRLTKRLGKIVGQFEAKPNLSIPAAMSCRAEVEASYRFFDNSKVTPEAILRPHFDATQARIRQHDTVLLVQDTTEVDLTRPEMVVEGAGPLEHESRSGAYFHPLVAFGANLIPLGQVWCKTWVRERIETKLSPDEKRKKRQALPIEEKESVRWIEGLRAGREVAESCPTTKCICIADSEADIYEMFAEPRGRLELLVRAGHNRRLAGEQAQLEEKVRSTPCLYESTVTVSGRKAKTKAETRGRKMDRSARLAEVEVRAATVTLKPPRRPDRRLPEVALNVVLVEEMNPPKGQTKIQWLLLTTLPIDDIEEVEQIVEYYCGRWQIEVYFRTLKSGCRIEARYFHRLGRLLNCLALYSVVAWKVLLLCRLNRECPDLDCETIFEPCEWKSVYMAVKRKEPPAEPPRLTEIIRMVASLGGYVIRAKTHPGTKTMWIGLQRLHDLSNAWNTFGPET